VTEQKLIDVGPPANVTGAAPFSLLGELFADPAMTALFSAEATVSSWLAAEAALARAQASAGLLTGEEAEQIAAAAVIENIDLDQLWEESRNVGYPILPLTRMVSAALPPGASGRVHYGATTQDIMDTGLALQLTAAVDRLAELLRCFGDEIAGLVDAHRDTVMAARTHAQQAVPTTLGAKLAVLLDELSRHAARLAGARGRVAWVSLHGAGGTSAAYGASASEVRRQVAALLGLQASDVPWHVARDGVVELGLVCGLVAATCGRFAQEVIDLSRTEIDEVAERGGHHRGASSTMPNKRNPIASEAVVGFAALAGAQSMALLRAMESGHERSAGEWQIEWHAVPQVAVLTASALSMAWDVAAGLEVRRESMLRNLDASRGMLVAEAYMMRLAEDLGRDRAHDLVYDAVQAAHRTGQTLGAALTALGHERDCPELIELQPIPPEQYVGDPGAVCAAALAHWRARVQAP
jgi:3-carboxy-cis,cis-muconate cycloisomerase